MNDIDMIAQHNFEVLRDEFDGGFDDEETEEKEEFDAADYAYESFIDEGIVR